MSKVRRVYVEKKPGYAVSAKSLSHELRHYLGLGGVSGCRVLIRYDIENVSDDVFEKAVRTVFSEPPVDDVFLESFENTGRSFSVEYLPGQFDQRADSAEQCMKLLGEKSDPVVRSATTYVIEGTVSDADLEAIKSFCINPVDSREASETKPESLQDNFSEPEDVEIMTGFCDMGESDFRNLYDSLSLAMTYADFEFIRDEFAKNEHRDPTITEIRVLDTYWSDHCRHTTFSTELKNITIEDGYYHDPIASTFEKYQDNFKVLYQGRDDKFVCLMDLATLAMKQLKKAGKLDDQEESDEINACSIVVPVEVDGKTEEWLINFKNETHNHPTEIEPFGGAATCLGGAIRDPLSGRTYVYQAMRVTGAADPTRPNSDTMPGKLPQKKLVRQAAAGYSSYGNQIGLATGYVKEIYHPDYVAKRMEIGAVIAAAPRRAVQRLTSDPGDVIILLGGRTGRDGIGGATGSSKAHNTMSTELCGAEVQKGNPPTERKLQRLFRREEVSKLIKKCNDFGAGGVSVAIGELAAGLDIDLDLVPKKYAGLDGTELSISESQERMAVVVSPSDVPAFLSYAAEENLEAVEVAKVTEDPRLVMKWRGKTIVDLSRAFLDTNGAHQETDVYVELPSRDTDPFEGFAVDGVADLLSKEDIKGAWLSTLSDLNVCSQKGLVEMFDSSIGAASVLMPYGGVSQLTETQTMVCKLPVGTHSCDAVSMMAYGFDPNLSTWSPYHGAIYAVTQSMARIVSSGGAPDKIRLTFQEYFRRMSEDPKRWSQPFAALLGAYEAQLQYELPSIGGKDSMSGTFNDIDVPPTLVSFAVDMAHEKDIITPELKKAGNSLILLSIPRDAFELPVYASVRKLYNFVHDMILRGHIISAYSIDQYGLAPAISKMAFGNGLGVRIDDERVSAHQLFKPGMGDLVCEIPADHLAAIENMLSEIGLADFMIRVGEVTDDAQITYGSTKITIDEAIDSWKATLDGVFATKASDDTTAITTPEYHEKNIYVCKNKVAKPRVFIPVFPGTNCEYDSARSFELAGAEADVRVFKNLSAQDITDSAAEFAKGIDAAQMMMFPGGFSAGDEPEGSAKFFASAYRNEVIKEAVDRLLSRDGLILGICNGFQALIKLGLLPYGRIGEQQPDSPTLTYNTIGRHISKMAYTKVVSDKSPWLAAAPVGSVYAIPASHGEGRFVANDQWLDDLFAKGQVATVYTDPQGNTSMDEEWNINGSFRAIEGITSEDGRIYGKMCHSERCGEAVAMNIYGEKDMRLFESGVSYFK